MATAAMIKAGANQAATGENAVVTACRKADVIIGPLGIIAADSLMGEITPASESRISASADCWRWRWRKSAKFLLDIPRPWIYSKKMFGTDRSLLGMQKRPGPEFSGF